MTPHPNRPADGVANTATLLGILGLTQGAVAGLAWNSGSEPTTLFFGGFCLGFIIWAVSQSLLAAQRRRRSAPALAGHEAVRWDASPLPRIGMLAATATWIVTSALGFVLWRGQEGFLGFLVVGVLGLVGLLSTLRGIRAKHSLTITRDSVRLESRSAWVEVQWRVIVGAQSTNKGNTLELMVANDSTPVPFPAQELPLHPVDAARIIHHYIEHPEARAALSPGSVEAILRA